MNTLWLLFSSVLVSLHTTRLHYRVVHFHCNTEGYWFVPKFAPASTTVTCNRLKAVVHAGIFRAASLATALGNLLPDFCGCTKMDATQCNILHAAYNDLSCRSVTHAHTGFETKALRDLLLSVLHVTMIRRNMQPLRKVQPDSTFCNDCCSKFCNRFNHFKLGCYTL